MTVSATSAYHAEMMLRLKRQRRRRDPLEVQMEYLPEEQCRAIGPKEDYCTFRYGHPGSCSWRKRTP